jgi:hypothetical protein
MGRVLLLLLVALDVEPFMPPSLLAAAERAVEGAKEKKEVKEADEVEITIPGCCSCCCSSSSSSCCCSIIMVLAHSARLSRRVSRPISVCGGRDTTKPLPRPLVTTEPASAMYVRRRCRRGSKGWVFPFPFPPLPAPLLVVVVVLLLLVVVALAAASSSME